MEKAFQLQYKFQQDSLIDGNRNRHCTILTSIKNNWTHSTLDYSEKETIILKRRFQVWL